MARVSDSPSIQVVRYPSDSHYRSSVDVPLAEGPVNLNWGNIMKNINENPYEFFKEGGWGFLSGTAVGEDGSDASDVESEESEFEMDEDDDVSSSSASESDYSAEDSDASESGSGSFSDDESGEDWDELERKAAKCGFSTAFLESVRFHRLIFCLTLFH